MDVVDPEAEAFAQHQRRTDVGGDHALFHDTVGHAARLRDDIGNVAVIVENKAVVRAIAEHQGMPLTPLGAGVGHAVQQSDLGGDSVARRLPVA